MDFLVGWFHFPKRAFEAAMYMRIEPARRLLHSPPSQSRQTECQRPQRQVVNCHRLHLMLIRRPGIMLGLQAIIWAMPLAKLLICLLPNLF